MHINYTYSQLAEIIISDISSGLSCDVYRDTNLAEIIDSLDYIYVIMLLEERFDIDILDNDVDKLIRKKHMTVDDVIIFLRKYGIYDVSQLRKDKLKKIKK